MRMNLNFVYKKCFSVIFTPYKKNLGYLGKKCELRFLILSLVWLTKESSYALVRAIKIFLCSVDLQITKMGMI